MADKIKLGEISKNLKITNKDIIAKLAEFGVELKSSASVVDEETIGLIFDIYTEMNQVSDEEIREMREAALKKASEDGNDEEKPAKKPAKKTEEKAEKPAKKEEKKAEEKTVKEVKKTEEKTEVKAEVKTETKAEKKEEKQKQEKHKKVAKKQSGQRIDLSNIDHTNTEEEYVVKTEEKKRYVDTRQSTVELDTIESRERIEDMVPDNIKMDKKGGKAKNKKGGKNRREKEKNQQPKKEIKAKVITEVEIPETITVGEFASKMGKTSAEVVKKLMMLGVMASQNQAIDFETAQLIGDDFGIEVKQEVVLTKEDMLMIETEEEDKPEDLVPRPPVVVVMGHVDHGKTSLLDAIRDTSVTDTEAGGITQHIGAYSVKLNDRLITFLDTPGHEAFTTMRARGAQVTDVAILVVAADDGVMPQTIEAINHAKAAKVPIIVAINKIDRPGANPDHVKQQLAEHELIPEDWGGDTIMVPVSAHQKTGISDLLEMILLVAEMQELKANPNLPAHGTIIEAQLDKGRGPVATVLVQRGTLHIGDTIIAGTSYGKVRAMINDRGEKVKKALPSTPVEVLGLNDVPAAGDILDSTDEKTARGVAEKRIAKKKEEEIKLNSKVSLDDLFQRIKEGEIKELNIVVKADVQGTIEALKASLEKIKNDEVKVAVVHAGVGAITESDVMLASAANALIIGFNVRPDANARKAAETEKVDVRTYRVIYDALNDVEAAIKGMLAPKFKEVIQGRVEIRQMITISKLKIAGCYVVEGKVTNSSKVRVVRDGIVVHEGVIESLRRFKDDVKEVAQGFECGITLEKFSDLKEGDIFEVYDMEEIAVE